MKRILILILCVVMLAAVVSCNKEEEPTPGIENEGSTSGSSGNGAGESGDKSQEIVVSNNSYKVDLSTLNIAWDDEKEPTQYQQETFAALVKTEFRGSKITFINENTVELSGTNFGNHDFVAENCERIMNELYAEVERKGKIDILIYEDKVSFMCDFFSGWYLSIDYKLK